MCPLPAENPPHHLLQLPTWRLWKKPAPGPQFTESDLWAPCFDTHAGATNSHPSRAAVFLWCQEYLLPRTRDQQEKALGAGADTERAVNEPVAVTTTAPMGTEKADSGAQFPICNFPPQAWERVMISPDLEATRFPRSVLNQTPFVSGLYHPKDGPWKENLSTGHPGEKALRRARSDLIGLQRLLVGTVCSGLVKHSGKLLCQSPLREEGLAEALDFTGACQESLIFCTDYF